MQCIIQRGQFCYVLIRNDIPTVHRRFVVFPRRSESLLSPVIVEQRQKLRPAFAEYLRRISAGQFVIAKLHERLSGFPKHILPITISGSNWSILASRELLCSDAQGLERFLNFCVPIDHVIDQLLPTLHDRFDGSVQQISRVPHALQLFLTDPIYGRGGSEIVCPCRRIFHGVHQVGGQLFRLPCRSFHLVGDLSDATNHRIK